MLFWLLLQYGMIVFAVVVGLLFTAAVCYLYYVHQKYDHLPGPKRDAFFQGHSSILKKVLAKEECFAEVYAKLHREYGPLVVLFFYHMPFLSAVDPKVVKELLLNNKYPKPSLNYDAFRSLFGVPFMGNGLVSECNHEKWAIHRRILNPAFHRQYLKELTGTFNESADRLVQYLSLKADGKTEVKLIHAFERVTLDVICKVAFSMEGDMIQQESLFGDAIHLCLDSMYQAGSPIIKIDPRKKYRDYRRDVKKAARLLRGTGLKVINDHLEDVRQGRELKKDILSHVIKSAVVDGNFTMEEMIDEFVTLFVGGYETTSTLLSFTMVCLGQNPHVLKKLLEEVDSVIGDKEDITYDDIIKMEYMMLVLKETLRLYPPVIGSTRLLPEDADILGYKVPAGSSVSILSYVMARMEEFFPDPLTFDPDRFKDSDNRTMYAYFPFSMGARSCIGQQFAMIEARVILCKILQKLDFKLVPNQDFGIYDQLTIRPSGDCANYISLRNK
ncbi:putative cholesterol 24-hydroxylase [Apostichopus japonicus]|uniref:Putative cholesterol 24-hydroxylase n=1 Tax=Stichopus japonicus TaxID=307972 RepID=A0A2G8LQX4_STIJA|nr:putative cholesterol 24-hydroxylase [Apostichopus japonicus]